MIAAPSRRRYLAGAATALRLGWHTGRWRSLTVVAIVVLSQASGIANALWFRSLVDQALAHHATGTIFAAAGAAATILASLFGYVRGYDAVRLPLREDVSRDIDVGLMQVLSRGPTLEVHERPDLLDAAEIVRSNRKDLSESFEDLVTWGAMAAQLLAGVVVLGTIEPRLAVLIVFALPSAWAARRADGLRAAAAAAAAPHLRQARYMEGLVSRPGPAREVRIFGLSETLQRRHEDSWDRAADLANGADARATGLTTAAWAVFVVGYSWVIYTVVQAAVRGRASAGDVILALALAAQFSGQVQGIIRNGHYLLLDLKVASAYRYLQDTGGPIARDSKLSPLRAVPSRLQRGVDLSSLTFRYPGSAGRALEEVSVRIPAGSLVALVGENGAGKTTLVKLLTGLIAPTGGTIRVDDTDLSEMDIEQWRSRTGASFQDFARFELEAMQTVGVGHLPKVEDPVSVGAAMERVSDSIAPPWLPEGLSTRLGGSWGGRELSGGQWQTMALARGAMRPDPLLLVLDEPTASLDPRAEHRVFQRYGQIARLAAARSGAITLMVTHRFASAIAADLILVLRHGRVVESGTHSELMEQGGHYAHLFQLQAQSYLR